MCGVGNNHAICSSNHMSSSMLWTLLLEDTITEAKRKVADSYRYCKDLGCHMAMGIHYLHVFVTKLHSKFGEGSCDGGGPCGGGGRFKTSGGSSMIL